MCKVVLAGLRVRNVERAGAKSQKSKNRGRGGATHGGARRRLAGTGGSLRSELRFGRRFDWEKEGREGKLTTGLFSREIDRKGARHGEAARWSWARGDEVPPVVFSLQILAAILCGAPATTYMRRGARIGHELTRILEKTLTGNGGGGLESGRRLGTIAARGVGEDSWRSGARRRRGEGGGAARGSANRASWRVGAALRATALPGGRVSACWRQEVGRGTSGPALFIGAGP